MIHPALLDFLEQALEDIPMVSDVGADISKLIALQSLKSPYLCFGPQLAYFTPLSY